MRNLSTKSIAIIEERKDVIIPIMRGIISDIVSNLISFSNSIKPDIVIAGIPIRKDNLAAECLFNPEYNPDVKVIPDLDTPGINANAWETPIKIILLVLIS